MKKKRDIYDKNMKKLQKFLSKEPKNEVTYTNIEKIVIESPKK